MTRTEAIELLEAVRAGNVCSYVGKSCDCKYGRMRAAKASHASEQTGCPELRDLAAMLGALSDKDWETLRAWAGLRR